MKRKAGIFAVLLTALAFLAMGIVPAVSAASLDQDSGQFLLAKGGVKAPTPATPAAPKKVKAAKPVKGKQHGIPRTAPGAPAAPAKVGP